MKQSGVRREIDLLVRTLKEHQDRYYRLSRPIVSDAEYDRLIDRLIRLEREYPEFASPDSPTQRVGSDFSQDFPEVAHTIPVLSLDKCYSGSELVEWTRKIERSLGNRASFIMEEKIDGSSIVLYYEAGVLQRAVTRGNGLIGNDITGNVKTIPAVPLVLPRPVTVAVRGEIFLPHHLFSKINAAMETPYANPRNLAAGTLRRIKSSEVAKVPLDIFVYEGFFTEGFSAHFDIINELEALGFKLNEHFGFFSNHHDLDELRITHPTWFFGGIQHLYDYIDTETVDRENRTYGIDGLVLKVNELESRVTLGYTGHHPRWSMALKFESPAGKTRVKGIDIQIGRTGRVTPVARVEAVKISGTTITNVTLHNQEYIDALELAVGDTVEVSRRGDVIPAVERVLEKNEKGFTTWRMPEKCPTCHIPLDRKGAHHFCMNFDCPDQVRGRLHFFVARGQMDIENIGPETVDYLIDRGVIKTVQDLYLFDPNSLIEESGFGEKKVELIQQGIERSKERPFRRVLTALGIPELGQKAVDLIVDSGYRDIESLLDVARRDDAEALIRIHGLGDKMVNTILQEFRKPDLIETVESLRKIGLNLSEENENETTIDTSFAEQTWCVTGSFERFKPRDVAMEEVLKRGGRVTSQVSTKTTHLLAGQNPGSKLQKALALGIKIVEEQEFIGLLSEKKP